MDKPKGLRSVGDVLRPMEAELRERSERWRKQNAASGQPLSVPPEPVCATCRGGGYLSRPQLDQATGIAIGSQLVLCPVCGWKRLLAASGIPQQYLVTSGERPAVKEFDVALLTNRAAFDTVKAYIKNLRNIVRPAPVDDLGDAGEFSPAGLGLLLHGPNGSGKSHLAAMVGGAAINLGYTVRFTTFGDILKLVYDSIGSQDNSLTASLRKYTACELLILDDLGSESITEFAAGQLFALVNERMNNRRPTVITTNIDPNLLGDTLAGDSLQAKRLSERIVSVSLVTSVDSSRSHRLTNRNAAREWILKNQEDSTPLPTESE